MIETTKHVVGSGRNNETHGRNNEARSEKRKKIFLALVPLFISLNSSESSVHSKIDKIITVVVINLLIFTYWNTNGEFSWTNEISTIFQFY